MDELTQDVGIELHTESIIHRAEQLARLESDKIVDKVSLHITYTRKVGYNNVKKKLKPLKPDRVYVACIDFYLLVVGISYLE